MEESESKEEEKDGVITSINRLSEHMQGILSTARKYVSDSVEDFVSQKVGCLFPLMTHYAETFQRHDITTRKEFDKIIKKYFKHEEVQEVYEELLQTEDEWDSFLSDIDKVLIKQTSVDEVKLGEAGPNDIPLIDVGTGHQEEFDAEGAKIVVVSFGVEAGAKKWIEETSCPYTLLLDPDRKIYGSIGLVRSVSKTWGTKPLLYYAEQVAAGRELPAAYKNIEDDPNQMGGNLILDSEGRAVFIHRSQSSPDRPTVEKILSVIKKANKSAVNDLNKEGPSLSTQPQTQGIESSGTDVKHVTAKNRSLAQEQDASNSSSQS